MTPEVQKTLLTQLPAIIAALGSVLASILGYRNHRKIDQLNVSVNGRLTELLDQTGKAGNLQGRQDQRTEDASKK